MKITECHISNFGKFTDASFDFKDGLNTLCENNGFGKSTLAAFIKAMFFGFDNEGKRDDFENERKRYSPWRGGAYGGSIKFEADGREFLLERVFGKTKKSDEFSLRDAKTNLVDDTYSENIGEELFKIDSESFMRTVFISQSDCETETNGSINAKLTDLAENTDDINNYEKADERLKDILNALSPTRKTGEIYKLKNAMAALKEDIKPESELDRRAAELAEERSALLKTADDIRRRDGALKSLEAEARAYKDTQITREKYESLLSAFKKRRDDFNAGARYFKGEIPAKADLTAAAEKCGALAEKTVELNLYRLTADEDAELASLNEAFHSAPPSSEEIRAVNEKQKTVSALELEKAKRALSPLETAEIEEYGALFKDAAEDEKAIDAHISLWNKRGEKKNLLSSKKASRDMLCRLDDSARKSRSKNMPLLAAAVILIAAAVALMLMSKPAFAAVSAVLGIAAAIVWAAARGGKKDSGENRELDALRSEIATDEEYIKNAEDETRSFLAEYGEEYDDASAADALAALKSKARAYRSLLLKRAEYKKAADAPELKSLKSEIRSFITSIYPNADDSAEYLRKIEDGARRFKALLEKSENFKRCQRQCADYSADIRAFLNKHGFEPSERLKEQLDDIKNHLAVYEICEREYREAKTLKERFEADNAEALKKLGDTEKKEYKPLEELAGERAELGESLSAALKSAEETAARIDELNEAKDEIEDKKAELEELGGKYAALEKRRNTAELAREYLQNAKQSFTARYTEPIMKGFRKYYNIIGGDTERFHMDANIKITVDEAGMQRDVKFFSSGTKSLIGICMRMALVEAMYEGEKPPLIFDDPFVFLDGGHFKAAKTLLDEISKEYQVLYFTCGRQ
ncbi:MAG: AAA family ATPase [Firmicutes bacterium]|nr:AAA family ATPase [Bacillota bacterium]